MNGGDMRWYAKVLFFIQICQGNRGLSMANNNQCVNRHTKIDSSIVHQTFALKVFTINVMAT